MLEANLSVDCGLILSIHDELLFEVPVEEADVVARLIKITMESVCDLDVISI